MLHQQPHIFYKRAYLDKVAEYCTISNV